MKLNPDDLVVTSFATAEAAQGDDAAISTPQCPTPATICFICPPSKYTECELCEPTPNTTCFICPPISHDCW